MDQELEIVTNVNSVKNSIDLERKSDVFKRPASKPSSGSGINQFAAILKNMNRVKIIKKETPNLKTQKNHLNFDIDGKDILNLALLLFFLTLVRVGPNFLQGQNLTYGYRTKTVLVRQSHRNSFFRTMSGNTWTI
jgi:hypothetical protein